MHVLNLYMLSYFEDAKWYENFDDIAAGKYDAIFDNVNHTDSLILREVFGINKSPTLPKTKVDEDFEVHFSYVKRSLIENKDDFTFITGFNQDFKNDLNTVKQQLKDSAVHKIRYADAFLGNGELKSTESTKNLDINLYPNFKLMVESLCLQSYKVRFMIQKPGHVVPTHIDNLNHDESAMRFGIALNDWEYGQFWHFGKAVWTNWKAGDCISWEKLSPHGTANVGHADRYTLQITGIPSKDTIRLFDLQSNS